MDIIIPKYKTLIGSMYDDDYMSSPNTIYEIASIIFLLQSHPNDCIVIPGIRDFKDFKDLYDFYENNKFLTIYVKRCELYIPDKWIESLLHCIKSSKRYIMIPLTLDYESVEKENSLHANFLIYDKYKNSLERFEPNGYIMGKESYKCLGENDDIIKTFFKKYFKNLTYYSPYNFCPLYSFQAHETMSRSKLSNFLNKEGSCVTWSMWYTHLRLSNPDIPRDKLINTTIDAFKKNKIDYTYFIIGFTNLIEKIKNIIISSISNETKILKINDIIKNTMEEEYLKVKLINNIDYKTIPVEKRAVQYRVTPLPKPKIKKSIKLSKKLLEDYKSTKGKRKIKTELKDLDVLPSRYLKNIKYY